MKRIMAKLLLLVLVLSLCACGRSDVVYDDEGDGKEPTDETHSRENDEKDDPLVDDQEELPADPTGEVVYFMTRRTQYGKDGELQGYILYECDEYGREIKLTNNSTHVVKETEYDGYTKNEYYYYRGDLSGRVEYVYDKDGNLLKETKYSSSSTNEPLSNTYRYDGNGNLTEKIEEKYGYHGIDETSYVYDYDSDGRLLNVYVNGKLQEEYTYFNDGTYKVYEPNVSGYAEMYFQVSLYNSKGNIIRKTIYDTDYDKVDSEDRYEYTYNPDGTLQKGIVYWSSGNRDEQLYEYDQHGNLIKVEKYHYTQLTGERGELYAWEEYEYIEVILPPA